MTSRRRLSALAGGAVLFALAFAVVRLVDSPGDAPSLLFVMPITLIAVVFGPAAGLAAALLGEGLFALDVALETRVEVGPLGYLTRAAAFVTIGAGLGLTTRRLRAQGERTRSILETSHEAFISMSSEGLITEWNKAAETVFGWPRSEVLGRRVGDAIVPPALRPSYEEGLRHYQATGEGPVFNKHLEFSALHRDGHEFPVEFTITPESGGASFHAFLRDITKRKEAEREREQLLTKVQAMARTDELTGLPNRRAWEEEIRRELARANRTNQPVCVVMLDLDRFKDYNDEHGHPAGDRMLREAAAAWRMTLRESDILARYGGEEFAAVLPDCPLDEARSTTERLRETTPDNQTCSAGVACFSGSESPEQLMRRADTAL